MCSCHPAALYALFHSQTRFVFLAVSAKFHPIFPAVLRQRRSGGRRGHGRSWRQLLAARGGRSWGHRNDVRIESALRGRGGGTARGKLELLQPTLPAVFWWPATGNTKMLFLLTSVFRWNISGTKQNGTAWNGIDWNVVEPIRKGRGVAMGGLNRTGRGRTGRNEAEPKGWHRGRDVQSCTGRNETEPNGTGLNGTEWDRTKGRHRKWKGIKWHGIQGHRKGWNRTGRNGTEWDGMTRNQTMYK